jgi:4,5-dihydroxyphthalate decarboxylase
MRELAGNAKLSVVPRFDPEAAARPLTIALNRYDRHVPFFNDAVKSPDGIVLKPLEIGESSDNRDGSGRHVRMLNDAAFDIAEMSMSSWIAGLSQERDVPLTGLPIFPRRFFSAGQIYVNVDSGIQKPADLIGRRVGLHSFQTTLSLLAKGDLKFEYGVPWEQINWVCMRSEAVPINVGPDVRIEKIGANDDIGVMLCEGEIDAMITPQPRESMLARPDRYRRLFPDVHAEEVRYFKKYGFFPIMHLVVLKTALIEEYPGLASGLMRMFEEAKNLAYSYYDDSNYSLLADARMLFEQQRADFSADPWPNGFEANRRNLEQFIKYSADQRLIPREFPAEQLFHPSTLAYVPTP